MERRCVQNICREASFIATGTKELFLDSYFKETNSVLLQNEKETQAIVQKIDHVQKERDNVAQVAAELNEQLLVLKAKNAELSQLISKLEGKSYVLLVIIL
jgi:uncharacterized membrane protein